MKCGGKLILRIMSLLVLSYILFLLGKELFQLFTAIQITGQNKLMKMTKPSPLEFLEAVYLNEELPLSVRMRAAIESLPYEHPKVPSRVQVNLDFGERLDRAIAASEKAKLIPNLIELTATQVDEAGENGE